MANRKKFLIPVTAAIASLVAGNSQATVDLKASATESKLDESASKPLVHPQEEVNRAVFANGGELHSVMLARNAQGVILAQHGSHVSHGSHGSHRSHTSGY